jgi:hypothetical protein
MFAKFKSLTVKNLSKIPLKTLLEGVLAINVSKNLANMFAKLSEHIR